MSQFLIPPPSKMDMTGDLVSNWEFFRDSWKNYATATKLADKDKKIVAATLLSIMGKECLHVCRNLPTTADERQDGDVIHTKLSEYFIPKRNKIFERFVFNSRSQKADESFDQFLTALRKLAATCEYGTFEDEMLCDRIVTGLRDHGHHGPRWWSPWSVVDHGPRGGPWWRPRGGLAWTTVHARTHEELHVPRARANTVATLMQPETVPHMVKPARNATRKIT